MTQRERLLSLLVGGLLVAAVIGWGLSKYRSAVKRRTNEITRLEQQQLKLNEQRLQGEYANRQMGEYIIRSLPGDAETARGRYQQWLLAAMQQHNLTERSVDPLPSRPIGRLYRQYTYVVRGNAAVSNMVELLHTFYSKDYLHRIRELSISPRRQGGFSIDMTIDSLALVAAPKDLPELERRSWRVNEDVASYQDAILNRNFFEPPNQAPRYAGSSKVKATIGKTNAIPLVFKDPDKNRLTYELVDVPELPDDTSIEINQRNGTLKVKAQEAKPLEVLVRVIDNGYPNRSVEQKIVVNVVSAPPPPKPAPPKLKFDDAKQTVLTALVYGGDEWTAWMHVRTRGKTLKLRAGDSFEVGTVNGKVVDVNQRFAMLEIDGEQFELRPSGKLGELEASEPDPAKSDPSK